MQLNGKQQALPVTDPNDIGSAWKALQALISQGIPQQPGIRPEPVAALIPGYLDDAGRRASPKTIRGYACYLRAFAARFGSVRPAQIEPGAVEMHASQQQWSDTNRANYLWTVQAFMRWAGAKDFRVHRPAKESRGADATITEDTHRLVLRETTGDFHELCRFLWATGCRPMEAARIEAEMVDWTSGTVTLKQHKMRHKGKRRILYLSSEALSILRGQLDRHKSGHLFRGLRGPLTVHAIVCRMLRVSEKIGRPVTAYGYRHSFCTRALAAGIPDTHVSALMGHSNTTMIHKFYSHINQNSRLLREAADKVPDRVGE